MARRKQSGDISGGAGVLVAAAEGNVDLPDSHQDGVA